MTRKIDGSTSATRTDAATGTRPPRNVIRPMYGVFIRDNLAKFRNELQVTIDDTKSAVAAGKPRAKEVFGDGVLQGSELTKAKAALKDLESALKQLKPVFPGLGAPPRNAASSTRTDMGRSPGRIVPMYGVVLRDDLSRFRSQISGLISDIKAGMTTLREAEQKEAKRAVTLLQAALKDLGKASRSFPS